MTFQSIRAAPQIVARDRPGDARPFVHRRIIGGVTGFLGGGGISGAIKGFATAGGGGAGGQPTGPGQMSFQPGSNCGTGFEWDQRLQRCIPLSFGAPQRRIALPRRPAPRTTSRRAAAGPVFGDGFGEAVLGQFGAALVPEEVTVITRRCPRGSVIATDGLCYNKPFPNHHREWPRGTRPLLTGGQVRALDKAAAARTRITSKRGRKLLAAAGLKVASR